MNDRQKHTGKCDGCGRYLKLWNLNVFCIRGRVVQCCRRCSGVLERLGAHDNHTEGT